MERFFKWDRVERDRWSYSEYNANYSFLIYKITKLPDFSETRFSYLNKEIDNRKAEVAKKQMQMIRQFHSLGNDWAISLRLVKDENINLYIIFRNASLNEINDFNFEKEKIKNALLVNEYSFEEVTENKEIKNLFDLDWCEEITEITKNEKIYYGDEYPTPNHDSQEFYSVFSWQPCDNNMEHICSSLMNHEGKSVVEIIIQPTSYLDEERDWINGSINHLKDCMNGEVIRNPNTNKILWQGKKLPVLKTPIDNFEKINKLYEQSHLFLCSIRIYADKNANSIGNAFLFNSVKNEGNLTVFKRNYGYFNYVERCYKLADISGQVHTYYWNKYASTAPYRAQRLNRLASVEEISNFFRIPIPIKPNFPGFSLDTGFGMKKKNVSNERIVLGNYLDIPGVDSQKSEFDIQQLAKHALIVGVPGSGKTTAMFNILYQLWNHRVPFIILEPAKTEYRALKRIPELKDDLLVFSLGDESVSPFRFNPLEVLPGIRLESHISKLLACFVGAFDLFDPLPIFLEQALQRTYQEKGWYDDSCGGEIGLEVPTLSDLCRNAEYIIANSGFDSKMKSDFAASLLERLNSLRRGSKGKMLDTKHTIPMEDLMNRPVVLELDSLNGDEKSLMMMFLLSYVFEYCKIKRKSGSKLKHMLFVEEAHNLIPANASGSDSRANPKAKTIELFVNMLAEMRALGQGILIADQLPTAISAQAVKQTNVKVMMRITSKDDREEIGNSMDLNEEQMHRVVNFKTGHAYIYHEGEDHVRMIRMVNFKGEHDVEEPPTDKELHQMMKQYEIDHSDLFIPYEECKQICTHCDKRTRNQAQFFVKNTLSNEKIDIYKQVFKTRYEQDLEQYRNSISFCAISYIASKREKQRIKDRYHAVNDKFMPCVYVHLLNYSKKQMDICKRTKTCDCSNNNRLCYLKKFKKE